ncbi:MAG TPA: tail fiber protein [Acidimicrobiales bacterium]|jgi:microcystin-dependent protein|nr:tail fiber protein [Acidimicrobiales bacterium]
MANPYVGEIRMFGGNFAPAGWHFCDGALLAISENSPLFTLLGTTYGGDGQSTFGLPNLQSRVPIHQGTGADGITYQIGQMAGVESVTLTTQQIPVHTHVLVGSTDPASSNNVQNNVAASLTAAGTASAYTTGNPSSPLDPSSVAVTGGSQPHENLAPYLVVNFIISLFGVFPSQT